MSHEAHHQWSQSALSPRNRTVGGCVTVGKRGILRSAPLYLPDKQINANKESKFWFEPFMKNILSYFLPKLLVIDRLFKYIVKHVFFGFICLYAVIAIWCIILLIYKRAAPDAEKNASILIASVIVPLVAMLSNGARNERP